MPQEQDPHAGRKFGEVLGCRIDALDMDAAIERLLAWAVTRSPRYVCACNAHSIVTAWRDAEFRRVINEADLAVPDGAPVAWSLRALGFKGQPRVAGPDLMWRFCAAAEAAGVSVMFLGSTDETLGRLVSKVRAAFPQLVIAGAQSLPFRPMTTSEELQTVDRIHDSGAGVVFLSLGCPKQERWMASHRGALRVPIVGVGAAFDFHAGRLRRAPPWMHRAGLEWLYRLTQDPVRLWRRYLVTNTLFVVGMIFQALGVADDPGALPEKSTHEL